MISYARQTQEEQPEASLPPVEEHIAPAPRVSVQAFDAVNYGGMAAYKICILFFNLVPYVAMRLAT